MLTREDLAAIGAMMDEKLAPIEKRLTENERRTQELKLLMENETNRAVNLVLEGHQGLRQMIEEHLVTKEEREQDRIRIHTLEEIAKLHTSQITDLQKKTS